MTPFLYAFISALIVSVISFAGVFTLSLKQELVHKVFVYFISLSAGALMGGALFHLLPEAVDDSADPLKVMVYVVLGFCLFFILEKFLRLHHHHDEACEHEEGHDHTHGGKLHLAYLNLIGDGIHNFIDGLILMATYAIDIKLGVAVTIATIVHEIPHEIGDFGVLLYAGLSRARALLYNFLGALTAVLGVIVGYFLIQSVDNITFYLVPLTAGGFIYIAAADLIPELHKDTKTHSSITSFVIFALMLGFMYWVKVFGGG